MTSTPSTQKPSPTSGTEPSFAPADGCAVDGLTFGYGPTPAVRGVSFAVPAGGFFTLLGPSGCGKTTLAKLIGGYLTPAAGRVLLAGRDVTDLPPDRRQVGVVFQNYALFPHLSARRNVSFGLEVRGMKRAEWTARADAMLERVGLTPAERDRKPAQLSGGQQQRVALARALVLSPDVLILDEPFANLDRHLREQLRGELRRLQRETGVTTVMVTHDQDEALAVSDLVGVMHAGRLLQVGPPAEVYDRPRTPFVARFLGDANLIPGPEFERAAEVVFLVRPERVGIDRDLGHYRRAWVGRVESVTFLGAGVVTEVDCGRFRMRVRTRDRIRYGVGQKVQVAVSAEALWELPDRDPD